MDEDVLRTVTWPTTYGGQAHPAPEKKAGCFGTWAEFVAQMEAILAPTAAGKGYSTTGLDGENTLYEFVESVVGGPGHACGEGIYKIVRYSRKRNPEDLVKLASWAYLMWRHHKAK